MALKVWIGENLDRRHEQEQMKEFLSLMHSVYDNQPGQCHVLCNFICGGSQIDAAVVKQDAFIVVEFKSANGIVSGAENGKWSFEDFDTCRRVEMKGGSHATNPFSQVTNARTAVASKLETSESVFFHKNECDRIADWRHFVHGLVLLEPDLEDGATDEISVDFHTKPWFSCCRMKDVSETIYRTTTRDGDLSNKNILKIIEQVLHLEKAEMRDGVPMMPNSEDDNEPKQEIEKPVVPEPAKFQQTLGDLIGKIAVKKGVRTPAPTIALQQRRPQELTDSHRDKRSEAERAPIEGFITNLKSACEALDSYFDSKVVSCARGDARQFPLQIEGAWDFVIGVKYKGDPEKALNKILMFIDHHPVTPRVAEDMIIWRFPEKDSVKENDNPSSFHLQCVGFLPPIFENLIAKYPHAKYSPNASRVALNGAGDEAHAEWYLGNYFPRSFCETFAIFDALFEGMRKELIMSETVSIFDVGIGSGAATAGLIWALRKWFMGTIKKIDVIGCDVNDPALKLCGDVACALASCWDAKINAQTSNQGLKGGLNLAGDRKFDFILASKAIQEMNRQVAYDDFVAMSEDRLKPKGLAFILEIFNAERGARLKSSVHSVNAARRLLLSSEAGTQFGVVSRLTRQMMEEDATFAVWGGVDLAQDVMRELKVTYRRPDSWSQSTPSEAKPDETEIDG